MAPAKVLETDQMWESEMVLVTASVRVLDPNKLSNSATKQESSGKN